MAVTAVSETTRPTGSNARLTGPALEGRDDDATAFRY
jgi:hypothetical protein